MILRSKLIKRVCSFWNSYQETRYGGITLDGTENDLDAPEFQSKLEAALDAWKADGKRGLWIKIPSRRADWIPICVKNGFDFHHAQPGFVMLTRWLPETEDSALPNYPFTTIGMGGLVVDKASGKILFIREMKGPYKGWKFPGGLVDPGEELLQAAQREVLEESGVLAHPLGILTFRHLPLAGKHDNCADIYMTTLLEVPEGASTQLKPCGHEVADARWFDICEVMSMEVPDTISPISIHSLKLYQDYQAGRQPLIECTFSGVRWNRKYYSFAAQKCVDVIKSGI